MIDRCLQLTYNMSGIYYRWLQAKQFKLLYMVVSNLVASGMII